MKFPATPLRTFLILLLATLSITKADSLIANPTNSLKVVGQARLSILFWDVYDSTLYSQNGLFQTKQTPLALKIDYLRDIDAEDLVQKTKQEWGDLQLPDDQIKRWVPQLIEIFPNIKQGDSLLMHLNENNVSEFYYNNKKFGQIKDPLFGHQFLRIWLDENCSYPKVCKKLRGN